MTKKLTNQNLLFVVLKNRIQDFNVCALCTGNYIRNGQTNELTDQNEPIQSKTDQTRPNKPHHSKQQTINQPTKPHQTRTNQTNQNKPNQTKPDQTWLNQTNHTEPINQPTKLY